MTGTPSNRKSNNNSLFKATLIKNSYNTSQFGGSSDDRKERGEEEYEEACDVGEENSPVCNSVNKMNIEKSMKHNPSKCENESSSSPKNHSSNSPSSSSTASKYGRSSLSKK